MFLFWIYLKLVAVWIFKEIAFLCKAKYSQNTPDIQNVLTLKYTKSQITKLRGVGVPNYQGGDLGCLVCELDFRFI